MSAFGGRGQPKAPLASTQIDHASGRYRPAFRVRANRNNTTASATDTANGKINRNTFRISRLGWSTMGRVMDLPPCARLLSHMSVFCFRSFQKPAQLAQNSLREKSKFPSAPNMFRIFKALSQNKFIAEKQK